MDCAEVGVEFQGGNMDNSAQTEMSSEDCHHSCRSTAGCQFWTYTPSDQQCALKESKGDTTALAGAISSPDNCSTFRCILKYIIIYILCFFLSPYPIIIYKYSNCFLSFPFIFPAILMSIIIKK